jgi:hypothetical protein
MCTEPNRRTSSTQRAQETIRLSRQGSDELRNALGQMELLMRTPHVNAGLRHLVVMLQHLHTLRREIG